MDRGRIAAKRRPRMCRLRPRRPVPGPHRRRLLQLSARGRAGGRAGGTACLPEGKADNTAGGAAAKRKPDAASAHGCRADMIAFHIILQPSPRLMRNNGIFFYPICLYRVLFCHKAHRAIEKQEHEACALFFCFNKTTTPSCAGESKRSFAVSFERSGRDGIQYQKMQHTMGRTPFTGGGAGDAGGRAFSAS